jgi:hypothetical protein
MPKQHSKPSKRSDHVPSNLDFSEGVQQLQDEWDARQPPLEELKKRDLAAMAAFRASKQGVSPDRKST